MSLSTILFTLARWVFLVVTGVVGGGDLSITGLVDGSAPCSEGWVVVLLRLGMLRLVKYKVQGSKYKYTGTCTYH